MTDSPVVTGCNPRATASRGHVSTNEVPHALIGCRFGASMCIVGSGVDTFCVGFSYKTPVSRLTTDSSLLHSPLYSTMPVFGDLPRRTNYPRYADRAQASEGYQRAFDRFIRKHRDWYGSILVRWEAWLLGARTTRSHEHALKVAMIDFNQFAYCFRAVLPPVINNLTLRQRRLNWERLCLKEKYDLEANQDAGWKATDTDVARLNAPHTPIDRRYLMPNDDGGNYNYPLEDHLDTYDPNTGMLTLFMS